MAPAIQVSRANWQLQLPEKSANITVFCAGEGNRLCCNPYTENTDDGDDDDLHMFDYADADFTGNWSLWRTLSMIWYHIKPHDTMKGPKMLAKQCIKILFF